MTESALRRLGLAFRIEWCLRGVFAVLLAGCAHAVKPCEFDVRVRVTPNAEDECLSLGVRRADDGRFLGGRDRILGCAPRGRIITNGTESNMGHEMKHQVEKNCP